MHTCLLLCLHAPVSHTRLRTALVASFAHRMPHVHNTEMDGSLADPCGPQNRAKRAIFLSLPARCHMALVASFAHAGFAYARCLQVRQHASVPAFSYRHGPCMARGCEFMSKVSNTKVEKLSQRAMRSLVCETCVCEACVCETCVCNALLVSHRTDMCGISPSLSTCAMLSSVLCSPTEPTSTSILTMQCPVYTMTTWDTQVKAYACFA
jgi:hypothetical protein